jgi:hypothetical protein
VDADADGGADGGAAGDAAGAVVLASLLAMPLAMPLAPQAFLALPCYCQPAHDWGGGFTVADGDRWVGGKEAARLHCCLLLWVQIDGLRCGMMR